MKCPNFALKKKPIDAMIKHILLLLFVSFNALASNDSPLPLPDSLVGRLKEHRKTDVARAEALETVILFFGERNRILDAQPYIKELESLSEELKDNYWKAAALFYKGQCAYYDYDFSEFLSLTNESFQMLETLRDTKRTRLLTAKIFLTKSAYFIYCQQFSECQECIEKGLEIAENNGFERVRNKLVNNYGILLLEMGQYEKAIPKFKALKESEVIHLFTLLNIAISYSQLEQFDSTFYYIDSLFQFAHTMNDDGPVLKESIAHAYSLKATCYNETGRFEDAIINLTLSDSILSCLDDKKILVKNLYTLAEAYNGLGEYEKALESIEQSIELSKEVSDIKTEWFATRLKSDILHSMKDYVAEVGNLRYFIVLTDTLVKRENREKVIEQKYQQEAKAMEWEYKIQQMSSRQRLIMTIVIASMVVVFIILITSILLSKRKRKAEKLSSDLDLRNREITSKTMSRMRTNEVLNEVIGKLKQLESTPKGNKNSLPMVIHELKAMIDDGSKKDFDYYFVQVHPNFYAHLKKDFPNLNQNELRLCAFVRANLNIKEIASLNNVSIDSVKSSRKRLRKSLGISDHKVDLPEFLSKY
jgi:tetratricopeptide (TPR) repeat protein